jgi:bifunctional non-homologous end joining protein LigD
MAEDRESSRDVPPEKRDDADSLQRYRSKRDFSKTAEPSGICSKQSEHIALAFVVQKHHASNLHYDFRLELDGVMLSWAVPKGPSYDPTVKRMAIRVEDHPVSYNTFEGTIPKGQYGAGTVIIWDRGTWAPIEDPREAIAAGKIAFTINGQKLHGLWELVRIRKPGQKRQDPWLLFKKHDAFERAASDYDVLTALPDSVVSKPASRRRRSKRLKSSNESDTGEKPERTRITDCAIPSPPERL